MPRINLCLFISVIFVNLLYLGKADINDIPEFRLCADPSCTEAISEAHGSVTYGKGNEYMLSFKRGDKMTIISKGDKDKNYWTAKIGDKIGFVPPNLVKEDKVYHPPDKLIHKVLVDIRKEIPKQPINLELENVKVVENSSGIEISSSLPDITEVKTSLDSSSSLDDVATESKNEASAPYEVIDGTTVHFDMLGDTENLKPSSTFPAVMETKIEESTTASPIPESSTENTNLNENQNKIPEENVDKIEDDEDDEDYDDEEDDDEDEEEEDKSKSQEVHELVAEKRKRVVSENSEAANASSEQNTEQSKEDNVKTNALDAPAEEKKEDAEETLETWGLNMFSTIANMVTESSEKEEDSTEKAEISDDFIKAEASDKTPENLANEIKEDKVDVEINVGAEATKESSNSADLSNDTVQIKDVKENSIPVETPKTLENTTSSLNVEAEIPLITENQLNMPPEQIQNALPSIPENQNVPPLIPDGLNISSNVEEKTTSSEDRGPDSSVPPLLRSFESTTEKIITREYSQPEKPPEVLRSEEFASNFIPMTEAVKVEEVTTEGYRRQNDVSSESYFAAEEKTDDAEIAKPEIAEIVTEVPPEPVREIFNDDEKNEEPGFFTSFLDSVYGLIGLQKGNPEGDSEVKNEIFENLNIQKPEKEEEKQNSVLEGNCKTIVGLETNCEDAPLAEETTHHIWDSWYSSNHSIDANATFYSTLLYLIITAVTVLLFTLGYYFIEENRKCSPLIAKVNNLEQQLMVSSAECVNLKDELEATKRKLVLYEDSSNNELVISLQTELKEAQKTRSELESTIESLQQELEAATEAGLDLNRMLSEVLTQKGGSDSLMESVERLQTQLDSQQKIIDDMNTSLIMKNEENEGLQVELASANEKVDNLEEELNDIKQNLHILLKEKEDVTSELSAKIGKLQSRLSQLSEAKEKEILVSKKNSEDLAKQLKELTDSLTLKEGELNALKESVKKIKTQKNFSVDELFDTAVVKAELAKAEKEKSALKDKLQGEEEARKTLENRVKSADAEVKKLRERYEEAEKEKIEAQTKLEVLSKYFKEKETQLQKELGLQEAMWLQKQGDDSTIYERMTSLQGEIDDYKSQNEMLKKEILDQERGLKSQIATLEKKAHENWVAARQAERKLEESKQEAAQLRNRLTMIEKNIDNELEAKPNHRLTEEMNGGETFSPLLHDASSPMPFPPMPLDPNNPSLLPPGFIPPPMFIPPPPPMFPHLPPPPPGGFMPPPPFLPGDRRPPPLGRMSSPPLNNRFSPPSPDYLVDRTSPPPLSPPPVRNYRSPNESERDRERFRHRTPPFPSYNPRDWEDSHSSGVSGFRPISSQRDSRKDHKGSTLSSGHSSSDSLDKSSRHSGRV